MRFLCAFLRESDYEGAYFDSLVLYTHLDPLEKTLLEEEKPRKKK